MVAQSVSVLDRLTGSPVGFVCFVCSCMLALLVVATILSGKFRSDLLAGSGQATVFGLFSVTGASVLAFVALLIAGAVITGKQASDATALTSEQARKVEDLTAQNGLLLDQKSDLEREKQALLDKLGIDDITVEREVVTLDSVTIDVNTKGSSKAPSGKVHFEVEHDGAILARAPCDLTGASASKTLTLSRPLPKSQRHDLIIRVERPDASGSGDRWDVQVDALGEFSNGDAERLLTIPEITIGGPHRASLREFIPDRYERVAVRHRPRYPRIFVNGEPVAAGNLPLREGATTAPVRTIAEALGASVEYTPAGEIRIQAQ